MASFYRVAYWELGFTGERINVAVMAYDDQQVLARGLRDWSRFEAFTGNAPGLVKLTEGNLAKLSPEEAESWTPHYMSALRLSEPRASLLSPPALLDDVADMFLGASRTARPGGAGDGRV